MEIWKSIKGYEGFYQVSNKGRIKSLKRKTIDGRSLKEIIRKLGLGFTGYYHIDLWKDNCAKTIKVHRLVAQAFIPNPDNKPQINHVNGIKSYNEVDNLEWCTARENVQHSFNKLGRIKIGQKGEACHKAKLTEKQVYEIKNLLHNTKLLQKEIAKKYDINHRTISGIKNSVIWKHLNEI